MAGIGTASPTRASSAWFPRNFLRCLQLRFSRASDWLRRGRRPDDLYRGQKLSDVQGWAARNHYAVWNASSFEDAPGYEDYAKVFRQGRELGENESILSEDCHLIGSPEEILEKIDFVQKQISLEYLILHPQHGSKDPAEARRSLELFAKGVLPKVHAMGTPLHPHSLGTDASLKHAGAMGGAVG